MASTATFGGGSAVGRWGRPLWTAAGAVFLALGAIGVPLPVLPTTPFLLLAAACFLRGSPRMYGWMMSNRLFGRQLAAFRAGQGVPARTKVLAITLLWLGIGVSIALVVPGTVWRLLLAAIGAAVTLHILTLPTRRPLD